jgi:hypothetical protein
MITLRSSLVGWPPRRDHADGEFRELIGWRATKRCGRLWVDAGAGLERATAEMVLTETAEWAILDGDTPHGA